jgi:YaiO family outer membrane protein
MNGLWVRGGAALTFACGASAGIPAGAAPIKSGARLASPTVVLRVDYTDFSKLFGDRVIASGESSFGVSKETQLALNVSSGRRRAGGNSIEATSVAGSIDHDWTDRLSSHTSIGLATTGSIFARRQFIQDFSYRFGGGFSATLGGKFADYGSNNRVTTWSAGAGYYFRGGSFSYRFSLLDSNRLGVSHAHLASLRLSDPAGSGSTQLWLGRGSSLYDVSASPTAAKGNFTSVALLRRQPIASGVSLNVGVNRTWYDTPNGSYRGTGATVGLTVANLKI